jgi:hypothetical protein
MDWMGQNQAINGRCKLVIQLIQKNDKLKSNIDFEHPFCMAIPVLEDTLLRKITILQYDPELKLGKPI